MVVVLDTGSTDSTVEKLQSRGATVYVKEIKPWRFDIARNISLSHVPDDVDICLCTDLDEVLNKGWREKLENAWQPNTTMGKYLYNWSVNDDGSPGVQFTYFKSHSRFGYVWNYPVHECLKYVGEGPEKSIFIDGMVLSHYPDNTKSRGSYLPLLELAVSETPLDDRVTYYLGREYMYSSEWEKCIETLKRHLSLPNSTWKEERCASMRWIAHSYFKLDNTKESYSWYYKAIAEAPHMRDAYVEFARVAYELKDWHTVYFLVEEALKITEKSKTYVNMAYSWDFTLNDLGAVSCYFLKMYNSSLEHAKKALKLAPKNQRLKENVNLIQKVCDGFKE